MTSAGMAGWRPLLVAGVAGGVGTSTWVRILQAVRLPVQDVREFRGGLVDVLVTSTTASATARVGPALAVCPVPPILVVMHTVPGVVVESRSHLRKAEPHVAARIDVGFRRSWVEMEYPPGPPVKDKELAGALYRFQAALQVMYSVPNGRPALPGIAALGARTVAMPAEGVSFGPGPVTHRGR